MKAIQKNKELKDFALYLIVGALATAVEWIIFFFLNQTFGINHLLATAIAFFFSTFANWGFGRLLVFKHGHESLVKELTKIYAASIVGLIINECIMYLGVDLLDMHAMLIKVIATGVAFFWNFLIRKLVIYNDGQKPKGKIGVFLMNHKGIIISILLIPLLFFGIFKFIVPTDIDNMGGMHSWLSGSTIKFVDYWLEEGPDNLKFTNYDAPSSIETSELKDREPYLSYPTGETMFVYLAAKLTGKSHITISFLHKFQMILFALEGVMMVTFIYLFSERTLKLKKDYQKIIISVATATLWMLLPTCAYYLNNIYYVDQSVILWTTALILIEYIFRTSKSKQTLLKTLRAILIYCGILIDYYFWILAFVIFVAEIANAIISQKGTTRRKELISTILWFGIPTILALLTFYLQISQTEGWIDIMKFKFGFRVTGEGFVTAALINMIKGHFMNAFTAMGSGSYYYLMFMIVVLLITGIAILVKTKNLKKLFTEPGISIIACIILSSVGQVFIFKQHSAIHEFSMIKVAYFIALLPIILFMEVRFLFLNKKETDKNIMSHFITGFLAVIFITGVPYSSIDYTSQRLEKADYSFEKELKNRTDYNDIVFSFTEEIISNPPQSLAISHKLIHKIENASEIDEMTSKYEGSKAVLVINKERIIEDETKKSEQTHLQETGEVRFENEKYIILSIKK